MAVHQHFNRAIQDLLRLLAGGQQGQGAAAQPPHQGIAAQRAAAIASGQGIAGQRAAAQGIAGRRAAAGGSAPPSGRAGQRANFPNQFGGPGGFNVLDFINQMAQNVTGAINPQFYRDFFGNNQVVPGTGSFVGQAPGFQQTISPASDISSRGSDLLSQLTRQQQQGGQSDYRREAEREFRSQEQPERPERGRSGGRRGRRSSRRRARQQRNEALLQRAMAGVPGAQFNAQGGQQSNQSGNPVITKPRPGGGPPIINFADQIAQTLPDGTQVDQGGRPVGGGATPPHEIIPFGGPPLPSPQGPGGQPHGIWNPFTRGGGGGMDPRVLQRMALGGSFGGPGGLPSPQGPGGPPHGPFNPFTPGGGPPRPQDPNGPGLDFTNTTGGLRPFNRNSFIDMLRQSGIGGLGRSSQGGSFTGGGTARERREASRQRRSGGGNGVPSNGQGGGQQSTLQQLLESFQGAQDSATEANTSRYDEILEGYRDRQQQGLDLIGGLSGSERDSVNRRYDQMLASAEQSMISRGLSNSTVVQSIRRGIEEQRGQELGRLEDRLRREQFLAQTGLSGDVLGFQERRTDAGPDQNLLAQLAQQIGAGGFGGGDGTDLSQPLGASTLGQVGTLPGQLSGGSPLSVSGGAGGGPQGGTSPYTTGRTQAFQGGGPGSYLDMARALSMGRGGSVGGINPAMASWLQTQIGQQNAAGAFDPRTGFPSTAPDPNANIHPMGAPSERPVPGVGISEKPTGAPSGILPFEPGAPVPPGLPPGTQQLPGQSVQSGTGPFIPIRQRLAMAGHPMQSATVQSPIMAAPQQVAGQPGILPRGPNQRKRKYQSQRRPLMQ